MNKLLQDSALHKILHHEGKTHEDTSKKYQLPVLMAESSLRGDTMKRPQTQTTNYTTNILVDLWYLDVYIYIHVEFSTFIIFIAFCVAVINI